ETGRRRRTGILVGVCWSTSRASSRSTAVAGSFSLTCIGEGTRWSPARRPGPSSMKSPQNALPIRTQMARPFIPKGDCLALRRNEPAIESSLAVEAGPFARLDEAGPVERMASIGSLQHLELRLTQRVAAAESGAQAGVVGSHRLARHRIAHWPERHHQRL